MIDRAGHSRKVLYEGPKVETPEEATAVNPVMKHLRQNGT